MSLSTCDYCGGPIPLGPDASNLCNGCGRHVFECAILPPVSGIDDSELVTLRAEVDGLRTRSKDIYTSLLAANDSTADMRGQRDNALNQREELRAEVASLRKENEALKKIERQRWENINKTFGTAYSTEQANKLMNLPMNVNDFGTLRPGDF